MKHLSDVSRFFAENWLPVQEFVESYENFTSELTQMLHSLEKDLKEQKWWDDSWSFVAQSSEQIYISRREWQVDTHYVVWIGLEKFNPRCLLGDDSPPVFYVYLYGKKHLDIARFLKEQLNKQNGSVIGDIEDRDFSSYVVKYECQKILPEEVGKIHEIVQSQALRFFSYYANMLMQYNGQIRKMIKSGA